MVFNFEQEQKPAPHARSQGLAGPEEHLGPEQTAVSSLQPVPLKIPERSTWCVSSGFQAPMHTFPLMVLGFRRLLGRKRFY